MQSTQDAPFAHLWLTHSSISTKSHTGLINTASFTNAWKLSLWSNIGVLFIPFLPVSQFDPVNPAEQLQE